MNTPLHIAMRVACLTEVYASYVARICFARCSDHWRHSSEATSRRDVSSQISVGNAIHQKPFVQLIFIFRLL